MQYNSRSPIYLQVIDDITKRMVMGKILPGEKLPSTRALAVEYEVNPNTAARIYKEMETMGLCYTERGLGTFMTNDKNVVERLRRETADKLTREFVREMKELGFSAQDIKTAIEEGMK
jgi:DNA-binding transcriptional regulator YhcF (GntR family)